MPERLSLFDPRVIPDPYSLYRRLREEDPVYWNEEAGVWILTRYADIQAALRDPRLIAGRLPGAAELRACGSEELIPIFRALADMMVFTDPPRHTRLRALVNRAFTPRRVEGMRAHIRQIVDGLLDAVQSQGRMDVLRDLAYPVPTIVITEMLGMPTEERARFREWSADFTAFLGSFHTTPEQNARAIRSLAALMRTFQALVPELRKNPRDDLLSALALAEEQGDVLTEEELLATSVLLLVAGHETTANLIGNGTLALLRHPDQLHALQARPDRIPNAVEELMRYDSPVQGTERRACEEIVIGGREIAPPQSVLLMFGAANRDPEQFPDPDRLDVTRGEVRHLAFGHGPHFCLGAPLARLEAQVALASLLERMPSLRLAGDTVTWRDQLMLRGLELLPVSF